MVACFSFLHKEKFIILNVVNKKKNVLTSDGACYVIPFSDREHVGRTVGAACLLLVQKSVLAAHAEQSRRPGLRGDYRGVWVSRCGFQCDFNAASSCLQAALKLTH